MGAVVPEEAARASRVAVVHVNQEAAAPRRAVLAAREQISWKFTTGYRIYLKLPENHKW
ncbi:hypothetical protein KL86DYS1_30452 [uncultured Dysgonomonas sp.]|uniref:Uncharacterized protein n=1 Tax=uncultured Dysgonomonas sp. TaxID=206096 RepID=A0A212JU56_9BACT|nr:hypothetical protein KL86DYS1_30452 [uncultured Dysgonomonas sp.]